jgi:DNA-directed RNA polymerase subunit RPC12/RpoP
LAMETIKLLGLARCLPEALPLYHYCLYSKCIRITPLHSSMLPFQCETCSIGRLNAPPTIMAPAEVPWEKVVGLISNWKPCCVFLDGIEPLSNISERFLEKIGDKPIAARTQGFTDIPGSVDAVVFDVFPGMYQGSSNLKVIESLGALTSTGLHVEVVFYLNQLKTAPLKPFIDQLNTETIIHLDYQGVVSETKAERLRETLGKLGFKYIYLRDSERWIWDDTECPYCGNRIVTRRNSITVTHHVNQDGTCGYCGHKLPFKNVYTVEDTGRKLMARKSILTEWLNIYALT